MSSNHENPSSFMSVDKESMSRTSPGDIADQEMNVPRQNLEPQRSKKTNIKAIQGSEQHDEDPAGEKVPVFTRRTTGQLEAD